MANLDDDGDTVEVQGSGAKPYVLKNVAGVLSCSCPAWRNQGGTIDRRTCKHLRKVRGAAVEEARICPSSAHVRTKTAVQPNVASEPREASEKRLFGCACERGSACDMAHDPTACACELCVLAEAEYRAGRKLRPDEKTKLFGPPVLLAESIENHMDLDPTGWWASEKLDGCRAIWTGKEFLSRQGNVFKAPAFFTADLPNHPLDGELWLGRQMFQKTMSIVRSDGAGDRWKDVKFVIFDNPAHSGAFEERIASLLEMENRLKPKYATVLRHTEILSKKNLENYLDEVVASGGEGLMLRKPGSKYEVGRSSTLLKVKKFSDAEAIVVSHTPGKGRHKGRIGALVVRMPNGKEFSLGTGLSDEERKDPPPVGTTVTYTFTELTDGGTGVPKCAAFLRVRPTE